LAQRPCLTRSFQHFASLYYILRSPGTGPRDAAGEVFIGFVGEGGEEPALEGRVVDGGGVLSVLVVPVSAAGARFGGIAGGEPLLRAVA
jgi:hypothetical protein